MTRTGRIVALALLACAAAGLIFWQTMPTHPAVRFGGILWLPVKPTDPWVPPSLRLAMRKHPPPATAGKMVWTTLAPGFEAGELPAYAEGIEVDRVLLARVDPRRFRFVVRNQPAGDRNLDAWMKALCPALVVNGSYYARDGKPDTPIVSDGHPLGPTSYVARQGAFVSSERATGIADLAHADWQDAFKGARDAMVSYPLLVGSDHAPKPSQWLANRSFVAQDRSGRILIGTTKGAYFSLDRLAAFLRTAPLDLKLALNLDGGPVACQGIALGGFTRRNCGRWEMQVTNGEAKVLPPWRLSLAPMPMALAAIPRDAKLRRCRQ
jgi:hypothetical protein